MARQKQSKQSINIHSQIQKRRQKKGKRRNHTEREKRVELQSDRQTERQSFNSQRENVKEKQCSSLFPSSFLALTSFTVFEEEGVSVSQFVILSVCLFVSHFVCLSVSLSVCRNIKFTNLFRNDKMTFYTFDFDFSMAG